MRVIHLPAIDKVVPVGAYVHAVKAAQANPERTFSTGFTTWWPTTGAEVMEQFRAGMMDRINEAVPYIERGLKGGGSMSITSAQDGANPRPQDLFSGLAASKAGQP